MTCKHEYDKRQKMELLSFKQKILELLKINQMAELGDKLLDAVLQNKTEIYAGYNRIIDDSKDWLQALWQYYEADRTEKKQDYTPKSLCKLVSALAGECNTLYDCCGGSGALTLQNLKDKNIDEVYIEELDKRVIPFLLFNLALQNANGTVVNGNVLTKEKYKIYSLAKGNKYSIVQEIQDEKLNDSYTFHCAVSNPPYNIKWEAPTPLFADNRFPVIPPASNANWAFALSCIAKADKAVLILPNGITSEQTEKEVRQYLIDNDLIEFVGIMPGKMFECTDIATCILMLNKKKKHKGEIFFIDSRKNCIKEEREQNGQFGGASHTNRTYKKVYNVLGNENIDKIMHALNSWQNIGEFVAIKTNKEVAENDYLLTPSRYIEFVEKEQPHRDFQEIADNINYISKMQNSCKLVINEAVAKKLGLDVETFNQGKINSKELKEQMKTLGIDIEVEDFIQFTKNKNEFIIKCNDKEILPDIFIQILSIWKSRIALLNSMQNHYLSELRDALLPELMRGNTIKGE